MLDDLFKKKNPSFERLQLICVKVKAHFCDFRSVFTFAYRRRSRFSESSEIPTANYACLLTIGSLPTKDEGISCIETKHAQHTHRDTLEGGEG